MDTISTYKSRIDALMNTLFGAGVSNPQTIIEQLNYLLFLRALSVKDDEAELLGIADESGKIFIGELAKYKWSNLLALNAEDLFKALEKAFDEIQKQSKNATVKMLFRNAHVKIFDKPTLRRVLHEIEVFAKELDTIAHGGNKDVFGDMYEYLLSKLASAGTNGQFRTPRHIIDFMVRVLDPKKNETILDPACGTAGFLVATYRYIAGEYTSEKMKKAGSPRAMDKLSSVEKNFLYNHMFTGFDSDEDMIKFGMMNLHLHGLTKSHLTRQNTLIDTAGTKDKFDVILANPPFKGSVEEESVSEDLRMGTSITALLFLRYMIDHVSDKGKMAVVVPDGVVSNPARVHKKIRQMLLKKNLWCVMSLPSGVFKPYSNVKTNILFFDYKVSAKTNKILFLDISNDGFDLGSQRKPIAQNDLPDALELLIQYKKSVDEQDLNVAKKIVAKSGLDVVLVETETISNDGDTAFVAGRYQKIVSSHKLKKGWSSHSLSEIAQINPPKAETRLIDKNTEVSFVRMEDVSEKSPNFSASRSIILEDAREKGYTYFRDGDVLLAKITPCFENGKAGIPSKLISGIGFGSTEFIVIRPNINLFPEYLYYLLRYGEVFREHAKKNMSGAGGQRRVPLDIVRNTRIPLPPIDIQKKIVAEFNNYQREIEEANCLAENKRQKIIEHVSGILE